VANHYPMGSQSTPERDDGTGDMAVGSSPPSTLPATARTAVDALLAGLDRRLPGRIEGFYVVGSTCLGAFRPDRSDVDFVAIVAGGRLDPGELSRLRNIHRRLWADALARDALRGRWPVVCNGSYLPPDALSRSPLEVTPLAGQVAGRFGIAEPGFDVNPITWHTLARHGIAIRGPDPASLNVRSDPAELRAWTIGNLNGYWRRWVGRVSRPGLATVRALPRRFTAWGVLGAPRLHYTLATGEIATKEEAGHYALEAFNPAFRPVIEEALAFWRREPPTAAYRRRTDRRRRDTAAFVDHVINSGNRLVAERDAGAA
jgi:Domain of unknown function (DUF4111)